MGNIAWCQSDTSSKIPDTIEGIVAAPERKPAETRDITIQYGDIFSEYVIINSVYQDEYKIVYKARSMKTGVLRCIKTIYKKLLKQE